MVKLMFIAYFSLMSLTMMACSVCVNDTVHLLHTLLFITPQYSDGDTTIKKHRLSDETLNRGPDSQWSLKIPWHFSSRVEM